MSASLPSADSATPAAEPKNVRWVLLGVMFAMLLSMLDNMVVGTAMPTIVGDLGGLEHISWVVTAYTLVTAVTTPVWGKFGDLIGRKPMYLASIAVFVAGSALCGLSQSMTQLIVFRIVQGIGAGGIGAGAFALIGALVPPRERGKYQGMGASIMAIGTIGGPLLGGFITSHFGWRWAFYVNLPLGLLTLGWLWLALHVPAKRIKARIDWAGIVLLTLTISAIVLAATWAGATYAWGSWQILALAAVAVTGLAAFIAVERRAAEPLLPPTVFTDHRNYPLAAVLILVAGVVMFGAGLYLPLFQQTVQGTSATHSGLLMLPMMIPVVIVSAIAGKVMSATGRYKIFPVLGTTFLAAGLGLLATMNTATSPGTTALYMVLVGIGLGFTLQMASTIAQNSVSMRDMGAAMSSVNLFRTLGGSLGVALFGALFTRSLHSHVPAAASDTATDPDALDRLPAAARHAYLQAVTDGTHQIFLAAAIACAVAFLAALFVIEVPLKKVGPPPAVDAPTNTPATTAH
ncbi:MDR family MFS transporter [Embleya scabrispora]|uniref:MDR family MFS transporter n=1 Tax=Embleya scabrispora TaxID=159449 RepID=UPI00039E38B1|nr:MDR family MFS transporter [Embleya scabrispora]MYS85783.1 DHA2 family efflux MFS transporter permease subunit [Streptomyces sp. SID5474]